MINPYVYFNTYFKFYFYASHCKTTVSIGIFPKKSRKNKSLKEDMNIQFNRHNFTT